MPACLRATLCVVVVVAAGGSFAPAASAQVDHTAAARELFRQGLAHSDAGEWDEAVADFERAYALRDAPPIAINLALALTHTGGLVRAAEMLHAAELHADADDSVREQARELLAGIEPRLGHLTVTLTGATAGVSVTVDGHPLAAELLGVPFPVDPGEHRVVATRAEAQVGEDTVEITEAGTGDVRLAIAPAPADAAVDGTGGGSGGGPDLGQGGDTGGTDTGGGSVFEEWWFWTILGVVVAAGVIVPIVIVTQTDQGLVEGNGNPPILRFEGMP